MQEIILSEQLFKGVITPYALLMQLGIAAILAVLVQWHFSVFSDTVSNKRELRIVIPLVCLTTVLVISVVKSSLALSLGLVGALSVIRFRTPIKEPEELAYLFLSIAIGLGLGADQITATIISVIFVLITVTLLKRILRAKTTKDIYLNVDVFSDEEISTNDINNIVLTYFSYADLVRYGYSDSVHQLVYRLKFSDPNTLSDFVYELRKKYTKLSANFVEVPKTPGL